jgi:hypothetical protein
MDGSVTEQPGPAYKAGKGTVRTANPAIPGESVHDAFPYGLLDRLLGKR